MFNPSPMQQPAQRPMPPQAPPQQPPATGSNFTMNEVPDLTAKLSMLPSNSLQQFAQLHKGDPYIMSLVMSESNRRKKLQQAGMQPQGEAPKVVDQMISSLALPEERGIAQLPTPNMANMADGGIAGYSDDEEGYAAGGVPGYADRGEVKEDLPSGVFRMGDKLMYRDASTGKMREYTQEAKKTGLADMLKAVSDFSNRNAGKPPALPPVPGAPAATAPTFPTPNQQGFMPGGTLPATAPPPMAPPPAPDNMAPQARPPAAAPAAVAAAPGITALDTDPTRLAAQQAALQKAPTNPFAGQIEDLEAAKRTAIEKQKTEFEADVAKAGPAFADREARLKAKEGRLEKQGADLGGMSLLEAGLAIMGGTSQNALANIGAGAQVGLKSYKAGLDKLEDSRDKLDEAHGRIEEFRRNEDSMNNKERRAMSRDIQNTYVEAKQLGLAALQDDWKLNRADAKSAFEVLENNKAKMYEQGQANYRARMQESGATARANMPGPQERLFATLGGGNVEKGFKIFTEANSEGRGDQAILAAYAKDPNALAMLKDTNPALYNMVTMRLNAQMMPGTVSAPAAGQVRAP